MEKKFTVGGWGGGGGGVFREGLSGYSKHSFVFSPYFTTRLVDLTRILVNFLLTSRIPQFTGLPSHDNYCLIHGVQHMLFRRFRQQE